LAGGSFVRDVGGADLERDRIHCGDNCDLLVTHRELLADHTSYPRRNCLASRFDHAAQHRVVLFVQRNRRQHAGSAAAAQNAALGGCFTSAFVLHGDSAP